jgi:hypothetical protein
MGSLIEELQGREAAAAKRRTERGTTAADDNDPADAS